MSEMRACRAKRFRGNCPAQYERERASAALPCAFTTRRRFGSSRKRSRTRRSTRVLATTGRAGIHAEAEELGARAFVRCAAVATDAIVDILGS